MSFNSEDFVRELIELYRSLPCLWKIKSPEYSNRIKKREAYEKIIALFKQHNPTEKVDESLVRRKIQGLRTVYKKELNKVEKSSKSGASTDEVYVPSLWYFDLLGFTRDQELPRETVTTVRQTLEPDKAIHNGPDSAVEDHHREEMGTPTNEDDGMSTARMEEPSEGSSRQSEASPALRRYSRKRKADGQPSPDLLALANNILLNQNQKTTDTFATFAADRLGKLDPTQRLHAERVIFEALSKASQGQLDESSKIQSAVDRDQSWPQVPDPHRSTPVRRICPPQNLLFPPQPPLQYPGFSQSFWTPMSSTPRPRHFPEESQYHDL